MFDSASPALSRSGLQGPSYEVFPPNLWPEDKCRENDLPSLPPKHVSEQRPLMAVLTVMDRSSRESCLGRCRDGQRKVIRMRWGDDLETERQALRAS